MKKKKKERQLCIRVWLHFNCVHIQYVQQTPLSSPGRLQIRAPKGPTGSFHFISIYRSEVLLLNIISPTNAERYTFHLDFITHLSVYLKCSLSLSLSYMLCNNALHRASVKVLVISKGDIFKYKSIKESAKKHHTKLSLLWSSLFNGVYKYLMLFKCKMWCTNIIVYSIS